MIRIENVTLQYPTGFTLSPVNLGLEAQKTHVFLGSSGSGKSTLLKIILGLETRNTGTVKIFDKKISSENQHEIARWVGYVPQESGLFPHLTAAENASLPGRVIGMGKAETRNRLKELQELVDLEPEWLERFPSQLSGGQRQRVALMRALFTNPEVIVLDEPLGALDPIIRARLQDDLKRVFSKLKKLVILVTHDLSEAAYFGHSIAMFHGGKLLQHGTFEEFVASPKDPFVTEFLQAYRKFEIDGL